MNLLRKTKIKLFRNLNGKKLFDNRTFWKKIKPYFSDKGNRPNKTMIVEIDKIVRKDKNVAEFMKNCFINITKSLNLKSSKNFNVNEKNS